MMPEPSALLVTTRALQLMSSLLPVGVFAFALYGDGQPTGSWRVQRSLLLICALLALGSGLLWLSLVAGRIYGAAGSVDPQMRHWLAILHATRFGQVWQWRFLLLLVWLPIALWYEHARRRRGLVVIGVAASAAGLASLAWIGHAGASGSILRLVADIAHLLAAGVWIGGLLPLYLLLRGIESTLGVEHARRTTRRFSIVGLICVGSLLASGIVNASPLGWQLWDWTHSQYGRLLLYKLGLFGVLLVIAARNRLWLTPALLSTQPLEAAGSLRRAIVAELVFAAAIIAVVGALGASMPPQHAQAGLSQQIVKFG